MKRKPVLFNKVILAATICAALSASSAQVQFLWSERIASNPNLPEGEPNIGLALDTNDNCYVTGFFDGTNNFGGVTLTNESVGGSDIFVAKFNATGTAQWVQRAGGTSTNYGRGIGVDGNGNVYAAGGYSGSAKFGGIILPDPSGVGFFLAKYDNAGAVQWAQTSTGGSDDVYGIGLTVDVAGNSYALVVVDHLGGAGGSVTFGSTIVTIPADGGTTITILVKYDNSGTVMWAEVLDSSQESYATKVAVDATGNVYVRGTFYSSLTIGSSNLTVGAGSTKDMFIAKFDSSGALTWVQHPPGGDVGEGGVAVDPAGNVYVSGGFGTNLNFGGGISLTNAARQALFGDAFVAKYNSSGTIQWAQRAGGTNGGFYWDLALDRQTNIYAAGLLGSDAAIAKYSSAGTFQWSEAASGPPASPVASGAAKCAVDSSGNCYLVGFYQGTATFGAITLHPREALNFFLAELTVSVSCPAIALSSLQPAIVGAAYNQTNTASGGTAPYTLAVTGGNLPPGFVLSSDGVLSGAPTNTGNYGFTVTATDANGCSGTNIYNLAVNCPTITLGSLPPAPVGTPYDQTDTAMGGTAPYTFALTSGSLPPGFVLSSDGTLSGTPTNTADYSFSVLATDAYGCTGSRTYTFEVGAVVVTPFLDSNGWFHGRLIGPAGSNFVILASTNAALPLSNWTSLTTNNAPGGIVDFTDTNRFYFTNKSGVQSYRFYRGWILP